MKNSVLKSLIIFVLIIFSQDTSFSQNWVSYSVANGLSNNSISAIVEDNHGKIWVGTFWGGLNEFDGRQWSVFSKANDYSIISDFITAILKDGEGNLWIGSIDGLSKIDPITDLRDPINWHNYNQTNTQGGLVGNFVVAIEEDNEGNIWIGIRDHGIVIVNPTAMTDQDPLLDLNNWTVVNSDSQLLSLTVFAVEKDVLGNIWVGTKGGVSRYDSDIHQIGGKWDLFPELGDVRSIFADSHGDVWFGRAGEGVARVRAENSEESEEFFLARDAVAIGEDSDGHIWFGTVDPFFGIFVVDPKSDLNDFGNWFEFKQQDGLASNINTSILRDSEGDMWIGTNESGISKYDISWLNFTFVNDFNLRFTNVTTIAEDDSNNLWFGTDDDGLRIVNLHDNLLVNNNWQTIRMREKALASNFINAIFKDDIGFFWIGTIPNQQGALEGLNLVNPYPLSNLSVSDNWLTFTVENTNSGLIDNTVNAIAQDKARYMWFGTNNGLSRVHRDSVIDISSWKNFGTSVGLKSNTINAILVDSPNFFWVGTEAGLNRVDLNGDLATGWEDIELFDGKIILTIFEDLEDNLWIGTFRDGVFKIAPSLDPHNSLNWLVFTREDGLASNHVQAMVQKRPNEYWFATSSGLTRLRVTDMAGPIDSVWTIFSAQDGPMDIQIKSAFLDSKADLWFGTAGSGVTRHRIKINPPDTIIESKLDASTADNIIVKFKGADTSTPSNRLLFSYQVDGGGWQPFLQTEIVQLFNLNVGRHVFEVRAVDLDGSIDPTPDSDIFYKLDPRFGGKIEVRDSDAVVVLNFPPRELEAGKGVLVTRVQNYELTDPKTIFAYDLVPTPSAFSLDRPASLSISFFDPQNSYGNQIAIFRSKDESKWIGIGGYLSRSGDTLTVATAIQEFGRYAVRNERLEVEEAVTKMNIQPRIFTPSGGGRGFGEQAGISFTLQQETPITLKIYNLAGRLVKVLAENQTMNAGRHVIEWNGRDNGEGICPSGLYIITMEAESRMETKTVAIVNK